jgi:hypothetical protein
MWAVALPKNEQSIAHDFEGFRSKCGIEAKSLSTEDVLAKHARCPSCLQKGPKIVGLKTGKIAP